MADSDAASFESLHRSSPAGNKANRIDFSCTCVCVCVCVWLIFYFTAAQADDVWLGKYLGRCCLVFGVWLLG